eukprot:CFRG4116T1
MYRPVRRRNTPRNCFGDDDKCIDVDNKCCKPIPATTMGYTDFKPMHSVYVMLKEREMNQLKGVFRTDANLFTCSRYLPNKNTTTVALLSNAFCGSYSADGDTFMSASQDMSIRLFDVTHRRYRLKRTIHCRDVHWSVLDVDFSPNKKHLIYSSWSPYVHLVDVGDDQLSIGETALNFSESDRQSDYGHMCFFSVKFSADSKYIVGGNNRGKLVAYDLTAMKPTAFIQGHTADVNTVAFAKDNSSILYSGSDDGLCKVWDTRLFSSNNNAKPVGVLVGHLAGLTSVDSKSDGRYLITNSKDNTVKLWDIRKMSTGQDAETIHGPGTDFDYRYGNARTHQRENPNDTSLMTYRGHYVRRTLIRAKFSSLHTTGERYIASGSADSDVLVWDVLTGNCVRTLTAHKETVRDVSFHPYDNMLASTSWDRTVRFWEYVDVDDSSPRQRRSSLFYNAGSNGSVDILYSSSSDRASSRSNSEDSDDIL